MNKDYATLEDALNEQDGLLVIGILYSVTGGSTSRVLQVIN